MCQAWSAKKAVVSTALSADRWDKQENAVAYVESLDQKVEFDYATPLTNPRDLGPENVVTRQGASTCI